MRAFVMIALLVACGGEDDVPPAPAPAPVAAGGAPKAGAPKPAGGKDLKPVQRIEQRVVCPIPTDAKKCDPKANVCAQGQYCIPAGAEHYCGPCPERDAIRHVFKPRDFQGADLRDPFQSFVIAQPGLGTGPDKTPQEVTPRCTRKDQFVASTYNYQSMKLVGVVSQGTQRKVLMMGGNLGYIVKKGDCVGKEKAFVKDIGAGFVTFAVEAQGKDPTEYSMQLYPTQVALTTPDAIDPGAASTPMVAPPSGTVAPPAPAPQSPAANAPTTQSTTTVIQPPQPKQNVVPPPQQAPTQLKP